MRVVRSVSSSLEGAVRKRAGEGNRGKKQNTRKIKCVFFFHERTVHLLNVTMMMVIWTGRKAVQAVAVNKSLKE